MPVHLVRGGGEHRSDAYRRINPQQRVPSLILDDGTVLTQSPAIIEYLEETFPLPPLLPADPIQRARIRAVAAIIGCDIHPLHNVGPLTHLRERFGASEDEIGRWVGHWIGEGLSAVEALIEDGHTYCFGPWPSLADVYLVPQVYAARRFGSALASLPKITRIVDYAEAQPLFRAAHPSRQPDAA